jgi:CMP-N,N'-diacetyllegionaminic acid synthase
MVVCMDIDGVIATITPGNDYALARPQQDVIDAVNLLYQAGHRIILFTARGSATGIDWSEVTRSQMVNWGVRHHEIRFGKPAADIYVDDRAVGIASLVRMTHSVTSLNKDLP